MARVVIDTNVLVSAIIGRGKPRRLLRQVLRNRSAVSSREMIAELADVLPRERFSLTAKQIGRFLSIYARRSEIVDLNRRIEAVNEDPDDNIMLGTAVNGRAAFIITGDKHLLALKEFEDVRIITVDAALRVLFAKK
jgi:putative PIN family toxin of toxin-antitoxin system